MLGGGALRAAEDWEAVARRWAGDQLKELIAEPWAVGWRGAQIGVVKRAVQSSQQIWSTGLAPAWWAEVVGTEGCVGYLLGEEAPPHRLVEFGIDAAVPVAQVPERACVLLEVPNLQQFPVPGKMRATVASGCVPTAGASVLGFWAGRGMEALVGATQGRGEEEFRALARRLRARMKMEEFVDEAGYTDDGMPLCGAFPADLVAAINAEAKARDVALTAGLERFSMKRLREEAGAGRPVLISCTVRLPHKPQLSWGHEVAGIGWVRVGLRDFVVIRDNFYPTRHAGAVRMLEPRVFSELISVTRRDAVAE